MGMLGEVMDAQRKAMGTRSPEEVQGWMAVPMLDSRLGRLAAAAAGEASGGMEGEVAVWKAWIGKAAVAAHPRGRSAWWVAVGWEGLVGRWAVMVAVG